MRKLNKLSCSFSEALWDERHWVYNNAKVLLAEAHRDLNLETIFPNSLIAKSCFSPTSHPQPRLVVHKVRQGLILTLGMGREQEEVLAPGPHVGTELWQPVRGYGGSFTGRRVSWPGGSRGWLFWGKGNSFYVELTFHFKNAVTACDWAQLEVQEPQDGKHMPAQSSCVYMSM